MDCVKIGKKSTTGKMCANEIREGVTGITIGPRRSDIVVFRILGVVNDEREGCTDDVEHGMRKRLEKRGVGFPICNGDAPPK